MHGKNVAGSPQKIKNISVLFFKFFINISLQISPAVSNKMVFYRRAFISLVRDARLLRMLVLVAADSF